MKTKAIKVASVVFAVALLIPFVVNLAGWNLYFYLHLKGRDLILCAANGTSHNALSPPLREMTKGTVLMNGPREITIVDLGPSEIFALERTDSMTPLYFDMNWGSKFQYYAIEFPWLLLLLLPVSLWLAASKFYASRSD